jgi:bifunctional DNA-binding transcriptional regulator/antitoxin component of YhaV-PrlF toxin-antitoxin module
VRSTDPSLTSRTRGPNIPRQARGEGSIPFTRALVASLYSMARIVKGGAVTRVSSKNQITIPVAKLIESGMEAGDRVFVTSDGQGKLRVEKVEDVVTDYSGALSGRIEMPVDLDAEWD